jgi:hypothetical protein
MTLPTKPQTSSLKSMHRIVWSVIAIFVACGVTYPIAIARVSQMEKFKGSHVKSLTDKGTAPHPLNAKSVP